MSEYTKQELELIRDKNPGLSDSEFSAFISAAKRHDLDPLANQIYAQARGRGDKRRVSFPVQIDGLRAIAERTKCYAGSDDPVYNGSMNLYDFKQAEQNLETCTVTVWKMVDGQRCAFTAVGDFQFYYPKGGYTGMWDRGGPFMLAKCTEALALRKAFPGMGDLYIGEEMDQSASATPPEPPPVAEETEQELRDLTADLQSVMIETAENPKNSKAIEAMSTEDFAKAIIKKKNHGNPLTKFDLDKLLTAEQFKAAKLRQIAYEKKKKEADPTYRENQSAIIPAAAEPRHRPRKRKKDTLRTNTELPDKRLQQLVLPVIGLGLNDKEAPSAVLAWMGNHGYTKLDLADDIQFEKLRNDSAELSVDQWFDLIPKEQRIGA